MSVSIRETKPASVGGQPIGMDNNTNNNYNNYNQPNSNYSPGVGMMPQGYWMNQHTGNIITVDDMFNDSGQDGALVKLSDGQLITFSQFANDYIQVESDIEQSVSENVIPNTDSTVDNITDEPYFSLDEPLVTKDTIVNYVSSSNVNDINNDINNNIIEISKSKQMVIDLINNLSESGNKKPEVEITNVNIKNIPREALSSLIKYFNVTTSDIADVIFDKLVNKDVIKKCIVDYIDDVKTKARCKNL